MLSIEISDQQLLTDLTPTAEKLFNRHFDTCKPWNPHEYVPYSMGEDYPKNYQWSVEDSPIKEEAVRSALYVNLLTEDNLPYYFETINRMFGNKDVWGQWNRRWVAEEGRHASAIRDFLMVTRAIDPVWLEEGRMQQMSLGEVPQPESAADGFAYVALQELATRIAHNKTGLKLPSDSAAGHAGQKIMRRVAADENFHHLFYRDMVSAAIEMSPSQTVKAIAEQVIDFYMPGTGIADFKTLSGHISMAGIFGANELLEDVHKQVVLKHWKVDEITGLDDEAKKALDKMHRRLKALGKVAQIETGMREEYRSKLKQSSQ